MEQGRNNTKSTIAKEKLEDNEVTLEKIEAMMKKKFSSEIVDKSPWSMLLFALAKQVGMDMKRLEELFNNVSIEKES